MDETTREAIFNEMQVHFSDTSLYQRLECFEADVQFALDHLEEWRLAYPDHWIAVFDRRLVATALDKEELVQIAASSNISLWDTYVDFLPREKPTFIL